MISPESFIDPKKYALYRNSALNGLDGNILGITAPVSELV
jgi:hypothetical protein